MTVYLVGAGPGDPGLLTVRGKELIETADVVVFDRLSASLIVDMAPAAAERINVGKSPTGPSTSQEDINALLVDRGAKGLKVVRLKGGDPFVFGRGGEECAALAEAGIAFEVVPGVTSASAAPAYAGVPLTHRGLSSSVTIVTGHDDDDTPGAADWEAVAKMGISGGTIVVLMGGSSRAEIAQRLMDQGLDADTPVTGITWGTRPEQVVVRTTLGRLGATDVKSPVTIVIGAVAALADELAWFQLPLVDRRVAIAAPTGENSTELSFGERIGAAVTRVGGDVTPIVTGARVAATDGGAALRDAIATTRLAAWVTFSSIAAVEAFATTAPRDFAFGDALVGCVGKSTGDAFERVYDRPADLVAFPANGIALAGAIGPAEVIGNKTVLVIGAEDPTPDLAEILTSAGWSPTEVAAYRLGPPPHAAIPPREVVDHADAIVCTSGSGATFLVNHAGLIAATAPVIAVGPTTAEALRHAGVHADRVITCETPSVEAVVSALLTLLG